MCSSQRAPVEIFISLNFSALWSSKHVSSDPRNRIVNDRIEQYESIENRADCEVVIGIIEIATIPLPER